MLFRASQTIAPDDPVDPRLDHLIQEFSAHLRDSAFPCFFATHALERDEFLFGLVTGGREGTVVGRESIAAGECEALDGVAVLMREAAEAIRSVPDQVVVLFVDVPAAGELKEEQRFSKMVLERLADRDRVPWPEGSPRNSQDPSWTFWFEGIDFFFNFSTPGHQRRRSRNLGPTVTIIVQSRSVFNGFGADSKARSIIRSRISAYDQIPPHPALGTYGDPANREVLQYFLGDSNSESIDLSPGSA